MFDWREFLRFAERLAAEKDEASLRTSISRAYYAAFHVAMLRAEALSLDTSPDRETCQSDHQACWDAYRAEGGPMLKKISADGDRLRVLRNRADYEDNLPDPAGQAAHAVVMARNLINRLASA